MEKGGGQMWIAVRQGQTGRLRVKLKRVTHPAMHFETGSSKVNSGGVRSVAKRAAQPLSVGEFRNRLACQVQSVAESEWVRVAQMIGMNPKVRMITCEAVNHLREAAGGTRHWKKLVSRLRVRRKCLGRQACAFCGRHLHAGAVAMA